MSKNQVKRCLINMQQRRQLVKSGQHYNKFVIVPFENGLVDEDVYSVTEMVDEWNEGGREAFAKAKKSNPVPKPSRAEKTPESDEITPPKRLFETVEVRLDVKDKVYILLVAAAASSLTAILLELL